MFQLLVAIYLPMNYGEAIADAWRMDRNNS